MSNNVEYIISLRDKFSGKLKGLQAQVEALDNRTNLFKNSLGGLSGVLGGIGFGAAAISVLKLGMNMEQAKVAFTVFLGSAEKANKALADLNEFANVTPYDNAEVIETGKSLLAFGVGADDLTGTLRKLGDVASGLNVPLNEMAQIYGKAMNKGKLQAEELNQLSERGVPIMQALADKFGVQKDQVYKLAEQGKITFSVFNEAFSSMSANGGDFFQMMEKQSQTTSGKLSTLVGNAQKLGITIAEKLMPTVNMLIEKFMVLVDWMQRNSTTIISLIMFVGKLIKYYAIYLITIKAVSIGLKVAEVATNLYRLAMIGLKGGIGKAVVALKTFKIALAETGIGLAIIAITELISMFNNYWDNLEERYKSLQERTKSFREETLQWQKSLGSNKYTEYEKLLQRIGARVSTINKYVSESEKKKISLLNLGEIESDMQILESKITELQKKVTSNGGGYYKDQINYIRKVLSVYNSQAQKIKSKLGVKDTTIDNTKETETKETKITSSAPKVFNINIDKLVENFTVSTNTLKESTNEIKEAVLNALLGSLNDTQIVLNQ